MIDKGNCRTWTEFVEDLYRDGEHFGARVAKIEKQIAPILTEVKPLTEKEEQILQNALDAQHRYQKATELTRLRERILESGCDPKMVAKIMRDTLGETTPEEEKLIDELTSDPFST